LVRLGYKNQWGCPNQPQPIREVKVMGFKHSDETKKKISEARKGQKLSKETIEKILKSRSGYKHSKETKSKISASNIGKNLGNKNPNWHGGTVVLNGYIYIYNPEHPHCNYNKYVREHRLVMEKFLGRYLTPEEVVHHINSDRADNRLENLMLFANKNEHSLYHGLHY